MEQGALHWGQIEHIDGIHGAHAQKHQVQSQNWRKFNPENKPWFCKQCQNGNCQFGKDHENFDRLQKHICSQCLFLGKILTHPLKDCYLIKKDQPKIAKGLLRISAYKSSERQWQ